METLSAVMEETGWTETSAPEPAPKSGAAPPVLTVSIVNTNNRKLLDLCLNSIYANTRRTAFEVIVIDNASTDGSAEMVRERFPEAQVYRVSPRNGYGYGQNRALEMSRGEYFLVFNEDMYVHPDALDIMVSIMENNPDIGALGAKLTWGDGRPQWSSSSFPTVFGEFFQNLFPITVAWKNSRFRTTHHTWAHDEERDVDVIVGACMLLRRSVIEEVGLFDEQFFVYSEEVDLCRRIRNAGWRIHFTPKATMIHYGAQTSKTMPVRMKIISLKSKFLYFRKHHGRTAALLVRLSYLMGSAIRWAGWNVARIAGIRDREEASSKAVMYGNSALWILGLYEGPKI